MKLSFRFARADEYPAISAFLHEYWANNHVYCRNKPLFDWTFAPRIFFDPQGDGSGYSFVMAEDAADGSLAGILGGIPFWFNVMGKRMKGVWIANYVIRPDHRRGTAALQLLSMFRKEPFEVTVASGINPATSTIYKVLRGEVLPEMPRHFLTLPGEAPRVENLLKVAQPEWTDEQRKSLAETFVLQRIPAVPEQVGSSVPESWDTVDWPAIAAKTIGAARDREYLNWRYCQHPDFKYRIITVPEGARTGLAVWRLETIRKAASDGTREDVDKIGRLIEFLPASVDNAEALFGAFIDQLKASGAMGADFYGFHGPTRTWLSNLGFKLAEEHPEGGKIPSRFQPLDGKGGGILSAMFVPAGTAPCEVSPQCPWYWTKSDSDQDRPN